MAEYYYLVASLPLLSYENRESIEPAEFLSSLRSYLDANALRTVAAARIDGATDRSVGSDSDQEITESSGLDESAAPDHPTLSGWNAFERGLRNTLVRLRAASIGRDASEHLRLDASGSDGTGATEISDAAREAANHESPLSGEDILNRARWAWLDELDAGHFFDLSRIITHYLRLQILARRRFFTREQGEERFTAINEKIMNEYYQEQSE